MPLPDWKTTRRGFIGGGAAGAALGAMALRVEAQQAELPPLTEYTPEFFGAEEWAFVMAACALLIPSDDDTPGAIEARVPVFIDLQMTGEFGAASDWYMEGPHDPSADPLLGYQSPLTPAEIYRQGIAAVNDWCSRSHDAVFADLPPETQLEVLTALDEDQIELAPEIRDFFTLLLQNTKEGFFADPMYGGNHRMAGWLHVGFPGARASYLEWMDKPGVPYPLGPVAISGERG